MPGFKQRKTPGVYVTELDAFPRSIVGVQTAVPAFIGYTQKAEISGKPVFNKPIKVGSMADFEAIFGGEYKPIYNIEEVTPKEVAADPDAFDFSVGGKYFKLTQTDNSKFYLYNSMELFYDNGGGDCWVVSVGAYEVDDGSGTKVPEKVDLSKLEKGLTAIADQTGPTMLVIPDAVLLPPATGTNQSDFSKLAQAMLKQCGALQDRVAILDVYGTQNLDQNSATFQTELDALIAKFQEEVGEVYLNYGMAYFPFLHASVIEQGDRNYTSFNINDGGQLTILQDEILKVQAAELYSGSQKTVVDQYVDDIDPATTDPNDTAAVTKLNQNLTNALPILKQMLQIVAGKEGLMPPSGAMAGIYKFIDQTRGVWNAPANVTLTSVGAPSIKLNSEQQGPLNVPLNGKAIDVIRQFVGRGTVVWGARTLDGNSNDWRYIQVRRTIIYIEQSIKLALNQFVFAANDGNTWVAVVSMVSNFLQGLWSQGGLMGDSASEAFSVECGLGSTMTAQDILEGYMVVQVTLQMIRPAEFIELTFKQKMEG